MGRTGGVGARHRTRCCRAHVVSEPLTTYVRWEHGYALTTSPPARRPSTGRTCSPRSSAATPRDSGRRSTTATNLAC
ncbi:DUF6879 family protein [Streptomyces sp. NPDC013181]|uniref:DUF6879 family protein n=1 Tax=Streptomyces sp. NPDC013181 TaxID=3364864 RepID=UPI0036C9DA69